MEKVHPCIKKIIDADPDTYIIFYVPECPFCRRALELLREKKVSYKGYNIHDIKGGMPRLLEMINKYADWFAFDKKHRTKPIIFKNKKFLGGADQLKEHFKKS